MSYSFIESRVMGRLPIPGSVLCTRQIMCKNVVIEGKRVPLRRSLGEIHNGYL